MRFGPIRVQYLLSFAVAGVYLPYMPLYLRERGLADWQIGWAMGLSGIAVLVMPLATSHLADRRMSNRRLIALANLGAGAALTGLALGHRVTTATGVAGVMALLLIYSLNQTPAFTLLDGLSFLSFDEARRLKLPHPRFAQVRFFGSIGFILPAIALWPVLGPSTGYSVAVWAAVICAGLGAFNALTLPGVGGKRNAEASDGSRLPSAQAWATLCRPPVRTIEGALMLMFMAISIYYAFYGRMLEQLEVPSRWIGPIVDAGVVAEIVIVLLAEPIGRRIGFRGIAIAGTVSTALRMVLLAVNWPGHTTAVAVAIGAQVLHGPMVLLLYFSLPAYLDYKAGGRFRNSMQGLHSMLVFGVSRLSGSAIGGYVAEANLHAAFALAAGLAGVAAVWVILRFDDPEASAHLHGVRELRPVGEPTEA